ncbi:hypothetical protein PoB_006713300 [Plakobranchus ocellatus]|uniref:Uncharacterized protein n=1 Tax=Plakobranchus ocellatus TaxID=259542 RepID=A0AAV4D9A0_9GAST|nr:hypothetical protein PoB_006713300 [Plakobranchus ocellatus]
MPGCRTPKVTVDEEHKDRIQHRITKAEEKSAKEKWTQDLTKHFRTEGSEAQRMAQDRSALGKAFCEGYISSEIWLTKKGVLCSKCVKQIVRTQGFNGVVYLSLADIFDMELVMEIRLGVQQAYLSCLI